MASGVSAMFAGPAALFGILLLSVAILPLGLLPPQFEPWLLCWLVGLGVEYFLFLETRGPSRCHFLVKLFAMLFFAISNIALFACFLFAGYHIC